jgi:hypothetical protein
LHREARNTGEGISLVDLANFLCRHEEESVLASIDDLREILMYRGLITPEEETINYNTFQ